ncbi:MAG: Na+ antiporter [Firmicutes bacterium]|nr:Na+ antiporter [Bacillota bacterium]
MVLFLLLQKVAETGNASVTQGSADFCFSVLGRAGVGIILGSFASCITCEYDDHLIEITLTTIVAYGGYLAAEHYHVSGVIAVVAAIVVVRNYGMTRGMSPASRQSVMDFWEYAAFTANSIVFLLVGIEIANVFIFCFAMDIFVAIIVVLAARALCVYNLSGLLHYAGFNIPRSWQHVMVWSGLRGALSMAMVLGLGKSLAEYNQLVAMTFGVVLFSIVVQGLSLVPLVNRLGLRSEK